MSVHVLLNLINELGKRDKMQGLPSILFFFRNEYVSINHYPQHVLRFYIISYLCNAFVFCLKKQDVSKKAVSILILYHLFVLMFYLHTYSALLSKILFTILLLFDHATFCKVKNCISYLCINC